MVGRTGSRPQQRYVLRNASDMRIRLNATNHKTCCGRIQLLQTELGPGEATELVVDLVVAGKFGRILHEAAVVTDRPGDLPILLQTGAEVYPEIRVDPSDPSGPMDSTARISRAGSAIG